MDADNSHVGWKIDGWCIESREVIYRVGEKYIERITVCVTSDDDITISVGDLHKNK